MAENDTLKQMLAELMEERKQFLEERKELLRFLKRSSSESSGAGALAQESQATIVAALASRIPKFVFDPESNKTFEKWFARYGGIITNEGSALPEKVRVSLLSDKLEDNLYSQLASKICPHNPKEISFEEIVQHLNTMFNVKKSLFSWRFACTQLTKKEESHLEYTNKVNETCEMAQLRDVSVEDWKVFFWIRGLTSHDDSKMRTYFLKFLERRAEAKEKVTIRDLDEEWSKLNRQATDSSQIEAKTTEVNRVEQERPSQRKAFTCYNCDRTGHSSRECREDSSKCSKCSRMGHLAKFCSKLAKGGFNNQKSHRTAHANVISVTSGNEQSDGHNIKKHVEVQVNGQDMKFQLDTGADITLIGREAWKKLGSPELRSSKLVVLNASKKEMGIDGIFKCFFKIEDTIAEGDVYVGNVKRNLLGLSWIEKCPRMKFHLEKLVSLRKDDLEKPIEQKLKASFPNFFQPKSGSNTKGKTTQKVKAEEKSVFKPTKPIQFGALEAKDGGLEHQQARNVIQRKQFSKWVRPKKTDKTKKFRKEVCINSAFLEVESDKGGKVATLFPEVDRSKDEVVTSNLTANAEGKAVIDKKMARKELKRSKMEDQTLRRLEILVRQAEQLAQSLQQGLKLMQDGHEGSSERNLTALHRSSSSELLKGLSPSEANCGRNLTTPFSLSTPQSVHNRMYQARTANPKDYRNGTEQHGYDYQVGSEVLIKSYQVMGCSWSKGKVLKIIGAVHLLVSVEGKERKVHLNNVKMSSQASHDVLQDTRELKGPKAIGEEKSPEQKCSLAAKEDQRSSTSSASPSPSSSTSPSPSSSPSSSGPQEVLHQQQQRHLQASNVDKSSSSQQQLRHLQASNVDTPGTSQKQLRHLQKPQSHSRPWVRQPRPCSDPSSSK